MSAEPDWNPSTITLAPESQAAGPWLRWLLPSIADIFLLCGIVGAVTAGAAMVSSDGDPARHIAVGQHILATGRILDEDVFSYTRTGAPFVPYEWLAEILAAISYQLAGLAGTTLLHGTAFGAAFFILFRQIMSRPSGALVATAVVALAFAASSIHWLARPHIFTILGTAAFSALLDAWYSGRLPGRSLWALPAIMVVWVNLHGGFLIGLILIATYAAADLLRLITTAPGLGSPIRARLQILSVVGAACLIATLLTPSGIGLLGHVTSYLGKHLLVDRTYEYLSPNFHRAQFAPFLVLLLASVGMLALSPRRPGAHETLLLLGFGTFALYSARNIPLFAIVAAPLLASQLSALPGQTIGTRERLQARFSAWLGFNDRFTVSELSRRGHLWPAAGLVILLSVAIFQVRTGEPNPLGVGFDPKTLPVAAVDALKPQQPLSHGFNELGWGGYLIFRLWPTDQVFIDGQTDFYGEALAAQYIQVAELGEGWRDVLDRYGVRWVMYSTDSPLVRELALTPGWRLTHQDPVASVLMR
jgi:hypothetical protein